MSYDDNDTNTNRRKTSDDDDVSRRIKNKLSAYRLTVTNSYHVAQTLSAHKFPVTLIIIVIILTTTL